MSNDVWWDNVKFRDFCSHFINMTPEEIAADIKESLVKLIQLDDSGDSFGAMMVKNAKLRQGSPKSEASRQNGIKGGRPRKNQETTADGDTREDSQDRKSRTSANHYGDAATREGVLNLDGTHAPTKAEPGTPGKHSFAYSGRGGNVHLTDDEYAMLLQELGNKRKADKLIDSLDYAISDGKTFNAPHFHVLMHWNDYREEKAAEAAEMAKVNADARAEAYSRRGYKTAEERQQEELAKINDFCTGLRNGTIKIAKEG